MPDYFVSSGGFMLTVVPQKGEEVAEVIDFREVAPLAATKDMFHGDEGLARWVRNHFFLHSLSTVHVDFIGNYTDFAKYIKQVS